MTSPDLSSYAHDECSQNGEDGILRRIFSLLEIDRGWAVEFGAWDGVFLSNTHALIRDSGWKAVLIEANPDRFVELERNLAPYDVVCLNRFVTFQQPDRLDDLLAGTPIPQDFDLLSIDIDGNDYHVWDSLENYRPKVVAIEINPTMPNHIEFVQARDMSVRHGSSLLAMEKLAERKGYELAAVTACNGIFVRSDLYDSLGVTDNSLDHLRPGRDDETTLLHLFDGTLALAGRKVHPWNGIELEDKRVQILPSRLREYTPDATPRIRRLQRIWAWIYKRLPSF